MSTPSLTTTSYAILGLLAIQSWSAYDLTGFMRTSAVGAYWPRTESRLYEEPKNLVARGLLRSSKEYTGGRSRTVYRITGKGRRALRLWLDERGAQWQTEDEAMLKIIFADHGTKDQLLTNIRWAMEDLNDLVVRLLEFSPRVARGEGRFPNRLHITALSARQTAGLLRARLDFLRWAQGWVRDWNGTDFDAAKEKGAKALLAEVVDATEEIAAELRTILGPGEEGVP